MIESLKNFWNERNNREKSFLLVGVMVIFIYFFFDFLFFPMQNLVIEQQQLLEKNRETILLMEKVKPFIAQHAQTQKISFQAIDTSELLSTINQSYTKLGLKNFVSDLSQTSDGAVSLTLTACPFDRNLLLLIKLWQNHHIKVLQFQAIPAKVSGTANMTLRLSL